MRIGQRLLQAGVALFRPHRASGAIADRRCRAPSHVLTDPALCGPVTLALPQDVQTMAWDYPEDSSRLPRSSFARSRRGEAQLDARRRAAAQRASVR